MVRVEVRVRVRVRVRARVGVRARVRSGLGLKLGFGSGLAPPHREHSREHQEGRPAQLTQSLLGRCPRQRRPVQGEAQAREINV